MTVSVLLTASGGWEEDLRRVEGARERRNAGSASEEAPEPRTDRGVSAREFKSSGLTQRKFSDHRGIALSELHRSLRE